MVTDLTIFSFGIHSYSSLFGKKWYRGREPAQEFGRHLLGQNHQIAGKNRERDCPISVLKVHYRQLKLGPKLGYWKQSSLSESDFLV
jgi:hypothetical protein